MLKLSPLDFFMIGIPESFLIFLIIYSLSKRQIVRKDYILSSIILACGQYSIRMLPINFGVHTMLSVILVILISVSIVKIPVSKAISYSIIQTFIIAFSEELYMALLINIFKIDIKALSNKTLIKNLYVLPYLFIALVIILIIHAIVKANKKDMKV